MFEMYCDCPHCGEDTKVTFDITTLRTFERYENTCDNCDEEFTFEVLGRVCR